MSSRGQPLTQDVIPGQAATVLVWQLAGCPDPPGTVRWADEPVVCAICTREVTRSASVVQALGANFTDPAVFRDQGSDRVCPACVWCCSGRPPATLRLWSIVAAPGHPIPPSHEKAWLGPDTRGLCLTNRSDPSPVADLLLDPPTGPWTVSVAVSGQKHVLPYAQVNRGGDRWTVRLEATDVTATPSEWRLVLGHAATLRAAGHSAEHIRQGTPDLRAVKTSSDLHRWRRLADPIRPWVRSPLIDLALWCCTRTTIPIYTRLLDEEV